MKLLSSSGLIDKRVWSLQGLVPDLAKSPNSNEPIERNSRLVADQRSAIEIFPQLLASHELTS